MPFTPLPNYRLFPPSILHNQPHFSFLKYIHLFIKSLHHTQFSVRKRKRKMEKRTSCTGFVATVVLWLAVVGVMEAGAEDTLAVKCASEFQKVTPCLPFVTAKAAAPSKDCCSSVTDLKDSDPACLCFIIQQIHNGSNAAVKSMGVQESRLLQLPSSCKLANASVAECPKLLHLPPNSPDAAIFTGNSSSAATPVATPGTSSSPSTSTNDGFWHKPQLVASITLVIAVFFYAFPTGGSIGFV